MAESSSNSSGQQYQKQDHQANTQYTPDVSVLPPFSSANGNNTPPDSGIDEEGVGSELDSSSCTDDSLSWSSFSDVTGQEPFLPLSSSPSSTVSWEYSEYENNLMRRLSQAIRECKYSKVTAVNQSVGDEEALKKLVESLFKEVRDWQSTCLMQPSEDSLTSASSTGSEDQPRGFEEEHKHAVKYERLTLELMIPAIQNYQDKCVRLGIMLESAFHVLSTPMAILELGFLSICQPLEAVPKLRRRSQFGERNVVDKMTLLDHCEWFMREAKLQLPAVTVERKNGPEPCQIDYKILVCIRNAVTHGNVYAVGLNTADKVPKVIILKKRKDRGIYKNVVEMTIPEFVGICNKVRSHFLNWNLVTEVVTTFKNVIHERPTQVSSTKGPSEQV
jgi:hypothetical protein